MVTSSTNSARNSRLSTPKGSSSSLAASWSGWWRRLQWLECSLPHSNSNSNSNSNNHDAPHPWAETIFLVTVVAIFMVLSTWWSFWIRGVVDHKMLQHQRQRFPLLFPPTPPPKKKKSKKTVEPVVNTTVVPFVLPPPTWVDVAAEDRRAFPQWCGPLTLERIVQQPPPPPDTALLVVNAQGVSVAQGLATIPLRVQQLIQQAWDILELSRIDPHSPHQFRWPNVRRQLREHEAGFPVWLRVRGCTHNDNEKDGDTTLPLLAGCVAWKKTATARARGLPVPTEALLDLAQPHSTVWKQAFYHAAATWPWDLQIPQIVWRPLSKTTSPSLQQRLERFGQILQRRNITQASFWDLPQPRKKRGLWYSSSSQPTNQDDGRTPPSGTTTNDETDAVDHVYRDFQGILVVDTDEDPPEVRLASLTKALCSNAVVFYATKPSTTTSFYRDATALDPVQPWVHYVPLDDDDDKDFMQAWPRLVEDILQHPVEAQRIREAAQQWCAHHLTVPQLAMDWLEVWDWYLKKLVDSQADWPDEYWTDEHVQAVHQTTPLVPLADVLSQQADGAKPPAEEESSHQAALHIL